MFGRLLRSRSHPIATGIALGAIHLFLPDNPVLNSPCLSSDSLIVSATFNANSPTEDRHFKHSTKGWHVGGILDGHGGWQVADFACSNFLGMLMPRVLLHRPNDDNAITASLERAFGDVEKAYIDSVQHAYQLGFRDVGKVGTCALLALRNGRELYIANCGDCRAVLGSTLPAYRADTIQKINKTRNSGPQPSAADSYVSTRLSRDMNARTPLEALSLRLDHPGEDDIVKCKNPHACYVKGRLQLTRALGDLYLKHAAFNAPKAGNKAGGRHIPAPYTPPYVSPQPDITHFKLDSQDRFVILASDGVWDFLSDQEAVEVVAASVAAHAGSTDHAAADLVEATLVRAAELNDMTVDELKAIQEGSERRKRYDDTTAVVMFFSE